MKRIISGALLLALWGACQAPGQELAAPQPYVGMPQIEETPVSGAPGPSPWIRYTHNRVECCGPVGGDGPLAMELYFRTGPSVPVAGGRIHDAINTGWLWAGGGRSLFFDVEQIRAWTVDLGISHTYNNASHPDVEFAIPSEFIILGIPIPFSQTVNIRTLNRTYGNISLGREYYLVGSAYQGNTWRVGWDAGTRLGAASMQLNEVGGNEGYQRLGSFSWGILTALHTDIECIHGCCAWSVGFRFEFDETWTNFRNINSNEIWDVNLLGTIGVRY